MRTLRQIVRDRRTVAMIVVQPLVIMAIFGFAFASDVTHVSVAAANLDRGTMAAEVIERVDREVVEFAWYETDLEVERAVRSGSASAGVVFPVNFTRNLESGARGEVETARIVVYKDNTNPQLSGEVLAAILDAFEEALEDETGQEPAFELDERVVFGGEEDRAIEFLVPGVAAFTIFMLGSMLTAVAVVKERTGGTLERMLATPVRRSEVVLGLAGAFGVFGLAQAFIVLGIATVVFRVPIHGSVALALLVTTLVSLMAMSLGILLSGLARTEFQAMQSVILVVFPNMFLAGIFAPLEAMPTWMRGLSKAVPLTYAVRAERGIINHGHGLLDVLPDLLVLSAFVAAFFAIATATFGRKGA